MPIDDVEDNGCVYLEKCVPVVLVSDAKAYSIDYFKDSSIAVCFMVNGYMLRMWRSDVDCDMAADIMCDFFRTASLPDMTGWHCRKSIPSKKRQRRNYVLTARISDTLIWRMCSVLWKIS